MICRLTCLSVTLVLAAACSKPENPAQQAPSPVSVNAATPVANTPTMPTTLSAPSADGFIQDWLVLDPIALDGVGDHSEETEKPMFAKEYFKDQLTLIPHDKQSVKVNDKQLTWHKVTADDDQVDLAQFSADFNTDPNSCLYFGFTYVVAPADMKVKLAIGSDDSSVWWLNGEEVIRDYAGRGVTPDDDISNEVTLKKGLNTLRFAVIQGDGPTGACARFYDAADKPVTTLKVSTDVR